MNNETDKDVSGRMKNVTINTQTDACVYASGCFRNIQFSLYYICIHCIIKNEKENGNLRDATHRVYQDVFLPSR